MNKNKIKKKIKKQKKLVRNKKLYLVNIIKQAYAKKKKNAHFFIILNLCFRMKYCANIIQLVVVKTIPAIFLMIQQNFHANFYLYPENVKKVLGVNFLMNYFKTSKS